MWSWTGVAYYGLQFSAINRAALLFGAVFVLQGILLFHHAVIRRHLRFGALSGPAAWLGWLFLVYALLLYPLIGLWSGHRYPGMPMFGITPCPVTLFTLGIFLLTTGTRSAPPAPC